eukprot:575830-Prorocentrum_minimum.AAC.4
MLPARGAVARLRGLMAPLLGSPPAPQTPPPIGSSGECCLRGLGRTRSPTQENTPPFTRP